MTNDGHSHDHEHHEGHDHAHDEVKHTTVKPRAPRAPGAPAQDTDVVRIHYTGTLDDGKEFDSSKGRDPLEFVLGEHAVIKGFEDAVRGMNPGEKKAFTIEASEAYGDVNPELRQEVPRQALGEIEPEVGMVLAMNHPMANQPIPVHVVAVGNETVTLDLNHPLAGKRLHFAIELVEIR
jgi:peptidylprolyl isomerase